MKNIIKKFWVYLFIIFIFISCINLISYDSKLANKKILDEIELFKKDTISLQKDVKKLKVVLQKEIDCINKDQELIMEHEHDLD